MLFLVVYPKVHGQCTSLCLLIDACWDMIQTIVSHNPKQLAKETELIIE